MNDDLHREVDVPVPPSEMEGLQTIEEAVGLHLGNINASKLACRGGICLAILESLGYSQAMQDDTAAAMFAG